MVLLMHRKRRFPGGGSIDAEVVEISRPINWSSKSKSLKQKEVQNYVLFVPGSYLFVFVFFLFLNRLITFC